MLLASLQFQVRRDKRAEFVRTAENFASALRQLGGRQQRVETAQLADPVACAFERGSDSLAGVGERGRGRRVRTPDKVVTCVALRREVSERCVVVLAKEPALEEASGRLDEARVGFDPDDFDLRRSIRRWCVIGAVY